MAAGNNATSDADEQHPGEGEVKYSDNDSKYLAVTMQSPTLKKWLPGYVPTSPQTAVRVENTTERTSSQNFTVTPEFVKGSNASQFSNASYQYATFHQRPHFATQVTMTMNTSECCPENVTTLSNSTDAAGSSGGSDDALGPVIAGLCTAVGLLLCLWLICFAVEKRIHSRKRAVERHYLPQSRSYPIQVSEMRKALRDREPRSSWGIANPFSRGRNRNSENGEPSCIVHASRHVGGIKTPKITLTSASPEPRIPVIQEAPLEVPANGCPGKKLHTVRSAPAMVTFNMENSFCQYEEDNLSAASDNPSEDSEQIGNKPTRMFLTVGDAYTYTPGGVFLEEACSSPSISSEEIELGDRGVTNKDGAGAKEDDNKRKAREAVPCMSPPLSRLNVDFKLEIDDSHCLTR